MVVDRNKPKSISSAIFGVETAAKSCELKRCADRGSLTNLFLNFVVFACFATTRVNMRFLAKTTRDSAQGYIQCMKCIGNPLEWTDGRTDVRRYGRTDGHLIITSLPKFLGLIGYQISLAIELR